MSIVESNQTPEPPERPEDRLRDLLNNAPKGMGDNLRALNEEAGTNYPTSSEELQSNVVDEDETEFEDEMADEENRTKVNSDTDSLRTRSTDRPARKHSDPSFTTIEGEFVDEENTSIQKVPQKGLRLSRHAYNSLLQGKQLLSQLFRSDPEAQRLAQAVLEERLEADYLDGLNVTDRKRAEALKNQVIELNDALTQLNGEPTSIVGLYKNLSQENPDEYPALGTPEGFFGILDFHKKLAIQIFSTAEIASESGELEAQKILVPLREELNQIEIRSKAATAEEYIQAAPVLKEANELRGEVRAAWIRGLTIPIVKGVFEIPMLAIQGPVDRLSQWMKESEDKMVPISAIGGAIAGPVILFTTVAGSSAIMGEWLASNVVPGIGLGIFGGSLIMVASWEIVKSVAEWGSDKTKDAGQWINDKASEISESIKNR